MLILSHYKSHPFDDCNLQYLKMNNVKNYVTNDESVYNRL